MNDNKIDVSKKISDKILSGNKTSKAYVESKKNLEEIFLAVENNLLNDAHATTVKSIVKKIKSCLIDDFTNTLALSRLSSVENALISHSVNCTIIAMAIAITLEFDDSEVEILGAGCLLHDIGMVKVEGQIWKLPRKLDYIEKLSIWKHTIYGSDILSKINFLKGIPATMAYQHHERINGNGYPKGKNGSTLHKFSKLLSVADIFSSLISPRPFRDALHGNEVIRTMNNLKNCGEIKGEYADAVLKIAKTHNLLPENSKKKVLIIEDDLLISNMISKVLEHPKLKIELAENGIQGLEKTKQINPDLILLDIMMPELDGYGFMKIISKSNDFSNIPVIIITSKATVHDVRKMVALGAKNFIRKPIDHSQLREQVLGNLYLDTGMVPE